MKAIILAAGYGTRLYPLTLKTPKALIKVAGLTILDRLYRNLARVSHLDRIYIVTNDKFAADFNEWKKQLSESGESSIPIEVVNDGSTKEEDKLGAIGDIGFVLKKFLIEDDLLIVAGDNLIEDNLSEFAAFGVLLEAPVVALRQFPESIDLGQYNVVKTDVNGLITFFKEKPAGERGNVTAIALYFYPSNILRFILEYLRSGGSKDQPGRLVEWLYRRTPVGTYKLKGMWYDIGSRESLSEAEDKFKFL